MEPSARSLLGDKACRLKLGHSTVLSGGHFSFLGRIMDFAAAGKDGIEVRVELDQELCSGCGLCTETCPEVFDMGEETAKATVDVVPQGAEQACRQAAEDCPVQAINILGE